MLSLLLLPSVYPLLCVPFYQVIESEASVRGGGIQSGVLLRQLREVM